MNPSWNFGLLPATVKLPPEYFLRRGILLDCRGPLVIHEMSDWGFSVMVLTRSHDTFDGGMGGVKNYGVQVDKGAWIGSQSLLCGCHIGEGAIVAAGTVLRGQDVAPRVMVAGNPARVIARWDGGHWHYLAPEESGYSRRLE